MNNAAKNAAGEWLVYRTRFLIRAKQLTEPLSFVDALGREHRGQVGDYLVETSDGLRRIAPREIFEDIYIAMGPVHGRWLSPVSHDSAGEPGAERPLSGRSPVPLTTAAETPCAKRTINPAS